MGTFSIDIVIKSFCGVLIRWHHDFCCLVDANIFKLKPKARPQCFIKNVRKQRDKTTTTGCLVAGNRKQEVHELEHTVYKCTNNLRC